jgi:hypothetical protein
MQSNSNKIKTQKVTQYDYHEAQERLKGRKMNKVKRINKRQDWDVRSTDEV